MEEFRGLFRSIERLLGAGIKPIPHLIKRDKEWQGQEKSGHGHKDDSTESSINRW
jgi:hypothetical protein